MHTCRVTSESATNARLLAKRDHADRRPNTKPEQRRRKSDRRDFRSELALCLWCAAAMYGGQEL